LSKKAVFVLFLFEIFTKLKTQQNNFVHILWDKCEKLKFCIAQILQLNIFLDVKILKLQETLQQKKMLQISLSDLRKP
jgi:hypothetical protein